VTYNRLANFWGVHLTMTAFPNNPLSFSTNNIAGQLGAPR
jgi:hypothetical protein